MTYAHYLANIVDKAQQKYGPAESWTDRQVYATLKKICGIGDGFRVDCIADWLDTLKDAQLGDDTHPDGPREMRLHGDILFAEDDAESLEEACLQFYPNGASPISTEDPDDFGLCIYTKPLEIMRFEDLLTADEKARTVHTLYNNKDAYLMDLTNALTPVIITPADSAWAEDPESMADDMERLHTLNGLRLLPEKRAH